jgi:outer membrane immunogenic protein
MGRYRFLKIRLFATVAAALVSAPIVAAAADAVPVSRYQAAPIIPAFYNWSGFYLGGHIGVGWAGGGAGFLGGGQAGFNYQIGQWVLGVEAQASATSIKDTASATFVFTPGFAVGSASAEAHLDWISTLAARVGWAFDRWLVYGKLGGAWAHVSVEAAAGITSIAGTVGVTAFADKTSSGWMLGFGTEYALGNNWTAKVEYDMIDFGNDFVADNKVHLVKTGVNYRFGYGPSYY